MKHHLVLGEIEDFLTGKTIEDNHDERLRQKSVRFLVEKKQYTRGNLSGPVKLNVRAGEKKAIVKVDYIVRLFGKICMMLKYGPGSLVTRRRPALAASRLIESYQIPLVVVTNGIDAELLDGGSGKILGKGFDDIPSEPELIDKFDMLEFNRIMPDRAELENRIVYAYEVDDACPCDENICRI
ncbi:MAG: type I restriction enzyme HsdR N-terminal domain-containing protein [Desulfobacterales bacterium]